MKLYTWYQMARKPDTMIMLEKHSNGEYFILTAPVVSQQELQEDAVRNLHYLMNISIGEQIQPLDIRRIHLDCTNIAEARKEMIWYCRCEMDEPVVVHDSEGRVKPSVIHQQELPQPSYF